MRYSQGGTAITRVRLATDRYRQNGETETDWHDITCWGKLAEAVNNYVGKGDRLYVSGRLAQNSYETDDGQKRHRTEIHAQEVVLPRFQEGPTGPMECDRGQRVLTTPTTCRSSKLTPHRRPINDRQHGTTSSKGVAPLSFHPSLLQGDRDDHDNT